jgi:hypothetical protein
MAIRHRLVKSLEHESFTVRRVDIKEPESEPAMAHSFELLDLRRDDHWLMSTRGVGEILSTLRTLPMWSHSRRQPPGRLTRKGPTDWESSTRRSSASASAKTLCERHVWSVSTMFMALGGPMKAAGKRPRRQSTAKWL